MEELVREREDGGDKDSEKWYKCIVFRSSVAGKYGGGAFRTLRVAHSQPLGDQVGVAFHRTTKHLHISIYGQ